MKIIDEIQKSTADHKKLLVQSFEQLSDHKKVGGVEWGNTSG